MTRQATDGTPIPDVFTYTVPDEPSDDYIPYPPGIEEGRKAEFRNLFIEHTQIVNLKKQIALYSQLHSVRAKHAATKDAIKVYRSFRVLPYGEQQERITNPVGYHWFKYRLQYISDRIMDFSEDPAWREKIQKRGKKGIFVLNKGGRPGGRLRGVLYAASNDGHGVLKEAEASSENARRSCHRQGPCG